MKERSARRLLTAESGNEDEEELPSPMLAAFGLNLKDAGHTTSGG